ncbi:MAG: PAS domain S-box protein [Planctomycetota bacterium]|jgi:PAS domain S-box-containing protein
MEEFCKNCRDIAKEKEVVKKQGEDFAEIIHHARDILYRFNFVSNKYDYICGHVEQTTGLTPQEIMHAGMDFRLELLHPEDKAEFMRVYEGLANSTIEENELYLEYRTRHKDGHYIHRSDNLKIIRDENNQIIAIAGTARDITNHHQTEQQLISSEQRYKRLAEATFEGIAIHEQGRLMDVNPQFCKMFGYERDELIGFDGFKLAPPESIPQIKEHVANGFEGPYEVVCLRKDGSTFPVEVRAKGFQMDGKEVRVATFCDLTERTKLLQEIADSEVRYKRLSEASFEAIAIHDQGNIIDVNQQYIDLFGYTLDEVKQISGLDMIAPQSRDKVAEMMATGFQGIYEVFAMKKDGSTFPIKIQVRQSVLNGRPIRIAALRDLTIEKQNQQKLAESENKYRQLYENANVALFRTALDGTLLDCNRATWDFFDRHFDGQGFPEGYSVVDAYVDPNQRLEFIQALQEKGYVKHFEVQLKRPNGNLFWAAISATLNKQQNCIEGTLYDITIKKVLTKTEKEVLALLMEGKTNKEIAFQTGRSIRTVEDHRAHIMQKMGVDNLVDLTKKAISFEPPGEK